MSATKWVVPTTPPWMKPCCWVTVRFVGQMDFRIAGLDYRHGGPDQDHGLLAVEAVPHAGGEIRVGWVVHGLSPPARLCALWNAIECYVGRKRQLIAENEAGKDRLTGPARHFPLARATARCVHGRHIRRCRFRPAWLRCPPVAVPGRHGAGPAC